MSTASTNVPGGATAALTTGSSAPKLHLSQQQLFFPLPIVQNIENVVVLSNAEEHKVAFKVRTSALGRYAVKPTGGVLHPRDQIRIRFTLTTATMEVDGKTPSEETKDRFVIEARNVLPTDPADATALWHIAVPKEAISRLNLPCIYAPKSSLPPDLVASFSGPPAAPGGSREGTPGGGPTGASPAPSTTTVAGPTLSQGSTAASPAVAPRPPLVPPLPKLVPATGNDESNSGPSLSLSDTRTLPPLKGGGKPLTPRIGGAPSVTPLLTPREIAANAPTAGVVVQSGSVSPGGGRPPGSNPVVRSSGRTLMSMPAPSVTNAKQPRGFVMSLLLATLPKKIAIPLIVVTFAYAVMMQRP